VVYIYKKPNLHENQLATFVLDENEKMKPFSFRFLDNNLDDAVTNGNAQWDIRQKKDGGRFYKACYYAFVNEKSCMISGTFQWDPEEMAHHKDI